MFKKVFTALLLVSAVTLTGCSANKTTTSSSAPSGAEPAPASTAESAPAPSPQGQLISVAGSTSVGPLMEELVIAYEEKGGTSTVEVQQTGSSAGITAAIEGAADIGMSSRDLKAEEKEKGLVDTVIALDGIAIIVHPENPIAELTSQQITAIFKGEIKNWSEVGGQDGEIIVVSREEGSGTRGAFEELLKLQEEVEKDGKKVMQSTLTENALFENSTGAIKTTTSTTKNAIGYISLGTLDESVKALNVDGTPCSVESVKSKAYPIARPFLVCTKGEPTGAAAEFISYILSEDGQKVVTDHHYISVL